LNDERTSILALCAAKLKTIQGSSSSSAEMERGLLVFYDELIEALREDPQEIRDLEDHTSGSTKRSEAMRRGIESLRLGYTISQVVNGYGALCQSLNAYASEHSQEQIHSREFNLLNFCLDVAIAEAVTEFNRGQDDIITQNEVQRLGVLAHELRNSLATVAAAHRMIKSGMAGVGESTNKVLEEALNRMKEIIDDSLSEVQLRARGGL